MVPLVAQFALDHHAGLGASANAEHLAELGILPAIDLILVWARLPGRRLCGHPRLVVDDVEAVEVAVKNVVHMTLEDVQRCIGLAEQLLAFTHPILVTLLFLFELVCPRRLGLKLLDLLHDFGNFRILRPSPEVPGLGTLVQIHDLPMRFALLVEDLIHSGHRERRDRPGMSVDLLS